MKSKFQSTVTIISVLFTLGLPVHIYASANESYSLSDLEVLASDNSYIEFFDHAFDIRPSERSEVWKKMMEKMGEGYLKALSQKELLNRSDFQRMESLMSHNVLKTNEFFRQSRQEIGLKWFRQCFGEQSSPTSGCWIDLANYWAPDRQEADMAARLLAIVAPFLNSSQSKSSLRKNLKQNAKINEVFILHPMLITSIAGLQCSKPEIRSVVWTQALKDWSQATVTQNFVKTLEKWAHPKCWDTIAEWSRQFFKSGANQNQLDLAYELLTYKKTITLQERDLYLTNYLLASPTSGDLFNIAWNRIQELGFKPHERDQLLMHFKKWRPLPGKIFADINLTKRKTLSKHLKRHFPEYIDYYAHVCIDFYGAKKRFPDGNPALYCREMFDLAGTEKDLLPLATIESFKQSLAL